MSAFLKGLMRIDKFLKVSRLIKRRTVANEVADAGRVCVNGKPAKASYQVKEGDIITIMFAEKPLSVKVRATESVNGKRNAGSLYTVIDE